MLKAAYSDPEDLKRKRFRLDVLLAHYISKNKISLGDTRREFRPTNGTVADKVWQDLQRGWYNELAFSFPPRSSTLGLSFQDVNTNEEATATRFLFPSWRITTAYYAIYFFLRAITRLKQPVFRLEEHGATLRNFKSCALRPLERTLWHFPLNVAFCPNRRQDVRAIPQLRSRQVRFNYARHPRPPNHSPAEAYRWILSVFRHHARDGSAMKHYTLFDYLHDFRIWANYLEIEHLLNLRGPGYKAFLDQSLATILFFVGGIAELVFLACTSETIFRNRCQRFFEVVAASSTDIADKYSLMPPAQRLEVYTQLDLMRCGIEYAPKADPNRVQVRPNSLMNNRRVEPDGAANGSQPIRSETNSTSPAAGSRR
ncbi:MAG: hypothetical protein E8D45_01645 [Nitrospira sp.]|nr:MAG: hypothetical protein E8D45_01645 [Nitrospira sp.]